MTTQPSSYLRARMPGYQAQRPWRDRRFEALVVACSDGRFNEHIDEFIHLQLGISCYDRLYVPGGAGALAMGGTEFVRTQRILAECQFLIEAHDIRRAILFFHGPTADGPREASCGDYLRRMPTATVESIRDQQEQDARRLLHDGLGPNVSLDIHRCDVSRDGVVHFKPLSD